MRYSAFADIHPFKLNKIFFASLRLGVGLFFLLVAGQGGAESFKLHLGRLFAQGRTVEMEAAAASRLKEDPASPEPWLELANLRKSQGDYPGAVRAYRRYLSQKTDWKISVRLALCLEQMGNFDEADQALAILYRGHPDDPDVLWGLGRMRLFQSKWKAIRPKGFTAQDSLREAKKFLRKLVSRRSDFALATWQLAEVCRALGDWDQALDAYEKVLGQDASYKRAYRDIAELLARKGKIKEALARYEQAMAIDPDDVKLRREAGQLAKEAPQVAQRRQSQNLRLWIRYKAPPETLIAASPQTIRVGLCTGVVRVLFRCGSPLQLMTPAQTPLTVLAGGGEYQVRYVPAKRSRSGKEFWGLWNDRGKKLLVFDQNLWIVPTQPSQPLVLHAVPSNTGYFFAKEEDRAYRGLLEIVPRTGAGFQVVNRVTLEDYLAGVIPAEMPAHWPMEALKAQAIVARTYALSKLGRHNSEGFDVCDSVHCQVYRGLRGEMEKTNEAVRQTAGMVLRHGRKLLPVAFSAQCGGHTQDYAEAWGPHVPVVGVKDYDPRYNQDMEFPLSPASMESWIKEPREAYCRVYELKGYRNYRWVVDVSAKTIRKKCGSIGRIRRLIVTHRSTAGWADRLLVEGEAGNKEIKGDFIRSFLGGIRSNLIWIEPQFDPKGWPEEFLVYGGGWGHGVGMCQVGCYGMAKAGKTCGEILEHYFPKGEVKNLAAN